MEQKSEARLAQEAKLAEVGRVLGDISHEIKNLLMPVLAGTRLLQEELTDTFALMPQHGADKLLASEKRCGEIGEMLFLTTNGLHEHVQKIANCVKSLSSPPALTPCHIAIIADGVAGTLRVVAEEKGISLHLKHLTDLPPIQAGERRMFNVFYNLINNALSEVPPGGSITIRGAKGSDSRMISLSVNDTGPGMPPKIRDLCLWMVSSAGRQEVLGWGSRLSKMSSMPMVVESAWKANSAREQHSLSTFRSSQPQESPHQINTRALPAVSGSHRILSPNPLSAPSRNARRSYRLEYIVHQSTATGHRHFVPIGS